MSSGVEHLGISLLVLGRNVCSNPFPFLFRGFAFLSLSCKCSLYIQGTSPVSDTGFENIYSHFVGCLFTFLIMSLEAQKFFILMKSLLTMISLVACVLVL